MFADLHHLWRWPTAASIDALVKRLDLPPPPLECEWHHAVSDSTRIDDFVTLYENGGLTDDERFTLMEVILGSLEEAAHVDTSILKSNVWQKILALLEKNIEVHIFSVWYYSSIDDDIEDAWFIAPFMRSILLRHQGRFAKQ